MNVSILISHSNRIQCILNSICESPPITKNDDLTQLVIDSNTISVKVITNVVLGVEAKHDVINPRLKSYDECLKSLKIDKNMLSSKFIFYIVNSNISKKIIINYRLSIKNDILKLLETTHNISKRTYISDLKSSVNTALVLMPEVKDIFGTELIVIPCAHEIDNKNADGQCDVNTKYFQSQEYKTSCSLSSIHNKKDSCNKVSDFLTLNWSLYLPFYANNVRGAVNFAKKVHCRNTTAISMIIFYENNPLNKYTFNTVNSYVDYTIRQQAIEQARQQSIQQAAIEQSRQQARHPRQAIEQSRQHGLNNAISSAIREIQTNSEKEKNKKEVWSSDADILFVKDIIDEYSAETNLSKVKLLCGKDILTYFDLQGRQRDIISQIIHKIDLCCRLEISKQYIIQGIVNVLFGNNNHYHLLTAVHNDIVVGFMIAQYRECSFSPSTWSINLICTSLKHTPTSDISLSKGVEPISGTILLGAMLYSLKKRNINFAILELARGYLNPGFITYSKLGFVKNLSLINDTCFQDVNNLPMYVCLQDLTPEVIISLVKGEKRIKFTKDQDDTEFFELCSNGQKYKDIIIDTGLAKKANIKYKSQLNASKNHKDFVIDNKGLETLTEEDIPEPTLPYQTYHIVDVPKPTVHIGGKTRNKRKYKTRKSVLNKSKRRKGSMR